MSAAEGDDIEPLELVIPWDPHRTSENRRLHWAERSRLNSIAKTLARVAWVRAGFPTATEKVRASFLIRRGRQMDPANVLGGGIKAILDGLFVRGITPDDSAEWLEIGSVRVESGKQWAMRPEIVVSVEEIGSVEPEPKAVPHVGSDSERLDRIGKARRSGEKA